MEGSNVHKSIEGTSTEGRPVESHLSNEAKRLLVEASKDKSGTIISVRHLSGHAIQTNNINFTDSGDRRSVARWEAALEQLVDHELVVSRGGKYQFFELTDSGYKIADNLQNHVD